MLVWVLRDYPLTPSFSGGSIHRQIPHLQLIEGLNQKGLFTYGGRAQAGRIDGGEPVQGAARRLSGRTARGPEGQPLFPRAILRRSIVSS